MDWTNYIFFFLIGYIASFVGGLLGIGGGIISVPLMLIILKGSALLPKTLSMISILVLGIFGSIKYFRQRTRPDWSYCGLMAIGVIPGVIISSLFVTQYVRGVYFDVLLIVVLAFGLTMAFIRDKIKTLILPKFTLPFFGFGVSFICTLLGIGGGLMFIPVLLIFFSKNMKNIPPITLILKIIITAIGITINFTAHGSEIINSGFNWFLVIPLCLASILGSLTGPIVNKKLQEKHILWIYMIIMGLIIIKEIIAIILLYKFQIKI